MFACTLEAVSIVTLLSELTAGGVLMAPFLFVARSTTSPCATIRSVREGSGSSSLWMGM